MSFTYRSVAIGLSLLLMLTGCGTGGSLPSSAPPEQSQAEPAVSAPEEELPAGVVEELDRLAWIYEYYCGGRSLSDGVFGDGRGIYPTEDLAFGVLLEAGRLEGYWNAETQCWDIPYPLLDQVNRFFFEEMEPFPESAMEEVGYFSGAYQRSLPYTLETDRDLRLSREKDGSIALTYHRRMEGAVLTPVTYRFVPHQVEEVPEALRGEYQPGDTVYRIAEVTQRPDLLPGCADAVVEISTPEELLAAAERIDRGDYADRHATYRLTADIDLAGVKWTPMGRNLPVLEEGDERDPNPAGFSGVFDGGGHAIRNLTITEEQGKALISWQPDNSPERNYSGLGLFYAIGAEGIVKDLRLENAAIRLPLEHPGLGGCAAGLLAAFCRGELQNVSVQGELQAPYEAGGLVGSLSGYDTGAPAKGIATGCTADVAVTGCYEVGGLVGTLHYGTIRGCTVSGSVTAAPIANNDQPSAPSNIGGVIGLSVQGEADNCHSGAEVRTLVPARCVGAFCGLAEAGGIHASTVDRAKAGLWKPVGDYHRLEPEHPEIWFN